MKISFLCETNNFELTYVNAAVFILKDGREVTIDRNKTEWGRNYYDKLEMEWLDCYIWDGKNEIEITDEEFEDAHFVRFEVEDDAPDGYYIECVEMNGQNIRDYDGRLDIFSLDDGTPLYNNDARKKLDELIDHLTMNGYVFELYKEDVFLINIEDKSYYETILNERGFSYMINDNNVV